MKVQEVLLDGNKKRYMLLDKDGMPVVPVMKYLKYLDATGKSSNTLKTYCYALKEYFDYLYRNQEIQNDMIEKLMKQVFTGGRTRYKDFLYHVNKDKPSNKNILKLKEPRKKVQVLSKEEVEQIYKATTNIRDRLLIKI